MLFFFYYEGAVHHKYAQQGQTMKQQLCNAVHYKHPQTQKASEWRIHHDNAPDHSSQPVVIFS